MASSTQSTSAPRSTSDGFSSASPGGSDGVSRYDTARASGPSEVSSVAPSSPPLSPAEVARSHDESDSTSMSDGISIVWDTLETLLPPENECSDTRVLRDSAAPPRPGKGKGKALSSNGAATPTTTTTGTTTLEGEGSQRPSHRTAAKPLPLSFHCRSCLADPCVKPVATLCGHIFCHRCIVRELKTKMGCPVCQRPFFVRLDVGVTGS
ncbi:hypothetical protein GSI_14222 [Ganoderma sinense ZZ0214-1]|uniref:RING-type domain-containing protein n=1 Tax=Ganoderma sinense ZZ0214-1 TaxID=1077348 RepID=A0A2G8RSZ6_9APHY|nr:hypothetical protein GSI_14222 [Ganoderma sinense ZZ0214-1]